MVCERDVCTQFLGDVKPTMTRQEAPSTSVPLTPSTYRKFLLNFQFPLVLIPLSP